MHRLHAHLARLAVLLGFAVSVDASAAPSSTPGVNRYDAPVAGSHQPAGGARIVIDATADSVRSVVTNFGAYAQFISHFQKSRVVGLHGEATDVYLQVPVLKGAAKLWAVVRFERAKRVGDSEVIIGRMLKGNVKRLEVCWHIRTVTPERTELSLELFILTDLPVPEGILVPELRFAAAKGVYGASAEIRRRLPNLRTAT